jgi:uncharacterized protein (TIGR04255 family)
VKRRLYKNAGLVEVIAELHWELKGIQIAPGAKVDPFYDLFREKFLGVARAKGFAFQETVVPVEVPLELLPNKPRERVRASEGAWPLYQIGPGIFTANVVPPYSGWIDFRKTLLAGVEMLLECYPSASQYMKVSQLELRYIDAYTSRHGFSDFAKYVPQHLNFSLPMSDDFLSKYVADRSSYEFIGEAQFRATKPTNAFSAIKLSPGFANNERAAVMQILTRSDGPAGQHASEADAIMKWFDEAHESTNAWFEEILKPQLREAIGPLTEEEIQ